ncbi:fdxN element excision controlling factor protein [Calothrix sp. NIES-4071]|nr:fdxN element excision controlling factor protein [Calothrix sp. NIES-4071]BAZ58078.1 fdxN element excision controlling factor protein [Calothrix sp. NIES-4105]
MSAKDIFHNAAKAALQNDGTHVTEPLYLRLGDDQLRIDLAAERLIAAEREQEKIAALCKKFYWSVGNYRFSYRVGAISQL